MHVSYTYFFFSTFYQISRRHLCWCGLLFRFANTSQVNWITQSATEPSVTIPTFSRFVLRFRISARRCKTGTHLLFRAAVSVLLLTRHSFVCKTHFTFSVTDEAKNASCGVQFVLPGIALIAFDQD